MLQNLHVKNLALIDEVEVEEELTEVIRKAKRYGLSEEDIREMLELILEG